MDTVAVMWKRKIQKLVRWAGYDLVKAQAVALDLNGHPRIDDVGDGSLPRNRRGAEAEARGGMVPRLDPDHFYQLGSAAQDRREYGVAVRHYADALAIMHKHAPTVARLKELSVLYLAQADEAMQLGHSTQMKSALVKACEYDPTNNHERNRLDAIIRGEQQVDLTKRCFVYHDAVRGEIVHREAIQRCLEYVSMAGIVGEILEFGVLAGWSARMFCEGMRDLLNLRQIHLFDSFDGLPEYSAVDARSFEIAGRNLWPDKMRFTDSFITDLGASIDSHVAAHLSEVISPERIIVHHGFYSETLRADLKVKAALVHVDCDLYQSTIEVLQRLHAMDALQDGCVLMFDDWNCNKASPNYGERRAFREFLDSQRRFVASPFFTYGFNGAVFFLHDRSA